MKLLLVSLGCDKNRIDSEVMLGILNKHGFEFTDDEEEAEAALVNSCCFIGDAKEESINTILQLGERRKSGQLKALIVTGCLAQRYRDEILKEIPEVDEILGTSAIDHIAEAFEKCLSKNHKEVILEDVSLPVVGNRDRLMTTGGSYNYLRIAEGCDKNCTYCIIPKVRGHYRSVPMEQLVDEAKALADKGVNELIIIAQETTLYGTDLYGRKMLPELLSELCKIEGINWIRLMYCYPEEITKELIQVIKDEPKICHYIDMPLQSGADNVLKRMGRRTRNSEIRETVAYIREQIPDMCIRTTLITGFPGETAADFNETLELIQDLKFDRLGVFTYSQEEDTKAADMPDQISERTKKLRRTKAMKIQQQIAFDNAKANVGRTLDCVIEGRIEGDEDENGMIYVARTYRDAPDIDGYVFVSGVPYDLMTGKFIKVKITGAREYDLIGEMIDESAE